MATATVDPPLRPVRNANFTGKSERKRMRKSMVRAYVANRVAEARTGAAARADFYRQLRQMKERRILISGQMALLANMIESAVSKASTVPALVDNIEAKTPAQKNVVKGLYASIDETISAGHAAAKSASGAAEEMHAFSRRRIYYTEAV